MPEQNIQLPPYSMFSKTPVYADVPVEIEGDKQTAIVPGLQVPPVVEDQSDILYKVSQGGAARLDLIADEFYGTPELWWVLAQVNPGTDPLIGFELGQSVRVPTRTRLATLGILNV
jgi:hypothetical protein